ncbi:enoyl-CoA hydratase/isomerase family protein [Pseudooceanicola sp. LIPI14-2-Ac024]|uniref:enoyl-CoA hydratase/isomerase family protein n=1 Tax=Pseudooceanicola sp. LIPI14-2-Ac024 TaxID=3344875 RepID=UPI0035CF9E8D
MSDVVTITRDGPVAHITLNRPEAFNAFNTALRNGLKAAVAEVDYDDAIRVVVISGAGRGFCAGADLKEGVGGSPTNMMIDQEYRPFLSAIARSPKIWIAQVHGSAAGIGAALALTCDMMTMAEDASIYMAFAAISLVPDGGACWHLLRGMGYRRALQTIVEGRHIPAAQAVELGLANSAHAPDALADETAAWAARIAAGAPLAAAAAKRLLRGMDAMSLEDAISAEGVEQARLVRSKDAREGVAAFVEKRKAVFTGT